MATLRLIKTKLSTQFGSWLAYAAMPAAGIITAPILARALGPEGRGTLAAVLQPMTVADAFAAAGVPAAVAYYVGRTRSTTGTYRAAVPIVLLTSSAVSAILVCYAFMLDSRGVLDLRYSLLPWCLVVILGAFLATRRAGWQGLRKYQTIDIERGSAAGYRVVLIGLLAVAGATAVESYIWAYLIAGIAASMVLFRRMPVECSNPDYSPPSRQLLLRFSAGASIGTIAIALNNRLDQAILPSMISLAELGQYSVAVTLAEVPALFGVVLARNLLGDAANAVPRGELLRTFCVGLAAATISAATVAGCAPFLVVLAYGEEFAPAIAPVQVLSVGTILSTATVSASAVLVGKGWPLLGSLGPLAGGVATIVLFGYFSSDMSLMLACWLSVAVQLCASVVSVGAIGYISTSRVRLAIYNGKK